MQNILDKIINWCKIKQNVVLWKYDKSDSLFVWEREIWNTYLWENIWFEESWKWDFSLRPVCVIKVTWTTYFCVSMTTKWKKDNKFYFELKKWSFAILSQTKHLDRKRFKYRMWKISEEKYLELKEKLKDFIL